MSKRFSPTAWLAALALLALSMMSAPARSESQDRVSTWNCYGGRYAAGCVVTRRHGRLNPHVITVPAQSGEEAAAAQERDRRWAKRCEPVVRPDRYGMPRYSYSASGCEYGRLD
jgi:hypothetical protein